MFSWLLAVGVTEIIMSLRNMVLIILLSNMYGVA